LLYPLSYGGGDGAYFGALFAGDRAGWIRAYGSLVGRRSLPPVCITTISIENFGREVTASVGVSGGEGKTLFWVVVATFRQGSLETTRRHPRRYEHTAARASNPSSGHLCAFASARLLSAYAAFHDANR
jgi:hypothetical protein